MSEAHSSFTLKERIAILVGETNGNKRLDSALDLIQKLPNELADFLFEDVVELSEIYGDEVPNIITTICQRYLPINETTQLRGFEVIQSEEVVMYIFDIQKSPFSMNMSKKVALYPSKYSVITMPGMPESNLRALIIRKNPPQEQN